MQKPILLALGSILGLAAPNATAQTALKVGDQLPDFVLPRVVNGTAPTFAPADAKGKVLVLEFWSTTCSPCIPALEKLAALQQSHPKELQVVGISTDSEARLQKFLAKRPLPVPLASAPDPDAINRLFPHRMVSHTVVVDKNRRVVAITSPEQFTEAALLDVAAGRPVRLKLKQDVMDSDPMSFFAVDSTTRYGVNVRPYIQGLQGMMRPAHTGPFAQRRITAINVNANTLFQLAYETTSRRILNHLPDSLRQIRRFEPGLLRLNRAARPGGQPAAHHAGSPAAVFARAGRVGAHHYARLRITAPQKPSPAARFSQTQKLQLRRWGIRHGRQPDGNPARLPRKRVG